MKTITISILFTVLGTINWSSKSKTQEFQEQLIIKNMKLKISFGDIQLTATLYDNPTARDFISMLPITTELKDYARNEKIFYPDRKLTYTNAPNGYTPSKGDITYYAPWGDVAIFYKDFSYSSGLISIGEIDNNGIEKLSKVGNEPVTFELIKTN